MAKFIQLTAQGVNPKSMFVNFDNVSYFCEITSVSGIISTMIFFNTPDGNNHSTITVAEIPAQIVDLLG